MARFLRVGRPFAGVLATVVALSAVVLPRTVGALELRGKTYFARPPWSVDLTSYYTTVWEPWAEYYFTITLDPGAGASLGGLEITQTRGVDRRFGFDLAASQAFLGRPRQRGQAIPVSVGFDPQERRFRVTFPEPVPPGSTVTLLLKPWNNPASADTYMFRIVAFPAGPNPSPTPLGYGTLRIYMPDRI